MAVNRIDRRRKTEKQMYQYYGFWKKWITLAAAMLVAMLVFYTVLAGYGTAAALFAEGFLWLLIGILIFMLSLVACLFFSFCLAREARFGRQVLDVAAAAGNGAAALGAPAEVKRKYRENPLMYPAFVQKCADTQGSVEAAHQLKIKQQQAAMEALQNQIHPHFLYNTLEIIRVNALLHNDVGTAESIAALGSLYRDIAVQKQEISLKEELNILERYLTLMQLLHPEDFVYQLDVSHRFDDFSTPKLWMQPLAENFFKHGYRGKDAINIFFLRERVIGQSLYLVFGNNGHRVSGQAMAEINAEMKREPVAAEKRIGLANVYARLHGFYGHAFSMKMLHNNGGGIKVMIKLPIVRRGGG